MQYAIIIRMWQTAATAEAEAAVAQHRVRPHAVAHDGMRSRDARRHELVPSGMCQLGTNFGCQAACLKQCVEHTLAILTCVLPPAFFTYGPVCSFLACQTPFRSASGGKRGAWAVFVYHRQLKPARFFFLLAGSRRGVNLSATLSP